MESMQLFINIGTMILDTLFPIECIGCKKEGEWICTGCAKLIPLSLQTTCLVCKKMSPRGETCFGCQKEFPLTRLVRFFDYDYPVVGKGIQRAKYGYIKNIFEYLVAIAAPHTYSILQESDIDPRALVFIPVPLHPRRVRMRGFNQAQVIAEGLAKACGANCLPLLTRTRMTLPQADLDELDRRVNIKRAFRLSDRKAVRNQYAILVDDVTTTGSTLAECARALYDADAKEVWGMVLAKG